MSRSTPSTAWTSPIRFWNRIPRVIGNHLRRPRIRTSGVSDVAGSGWGRLGDLDAHVRAITSSRNMRSLSASGEVTPRCVVTVGRQELGHVRPALVEHVGTARVERAARRHEDQGRWETADRDQALLLVALIEPGDRRQEPPRVRVMGPVVDVASVAGLDDLAGVHHLDVVAMLGHHAEVVRDDHDGGVELLLQPVEQVEDLRLDRHVEGRRGLVGDQQVRVERQRHRDHRPLTHAPGELVWVLVGAFVGTRDPDAAEHLDCLLVRLLLRDPLVDADRLGDLIAHLVVGMQRGHRVLEDHRDLLAPHVAHLVDREREQVLTLEDDLALDLRLVARR